MTAREADGPGYWMYEISGVLRAAVGAYLNDEPMTAQDIAAMRAYLRQWIGAPIWDQNPHAGPQERVWLAQMRARVDGLTSRAAINRWIDEATDQGLDPL